MDPKKQMKDDGTEGTRIGEVVNLQTQKRRSSAIVVIDKETKNKHFRPLTITGVVTFFREGNSPAALLRGFETT